MESKAGKWESKAGKSERRVEAVMRVHEICSPSIFMGQMRGYGYLELN